VKSFAFYAATCAAIILVVGGIAWAFTSPDGRPTVLAAAGVAFVVQLTAFAIARHMQQTNLFLGWGLGSLLRLMTLALFALIVARLWRAPLTPALLSLAGFLFITTVVEPLFLKR
jgi:hypothetical protein